MARTKPQIARPELGESLDSYLARGRTLDAESLLDFRPQEGDSLGEYLLRLRTASGITPEALEEMLGGFSSNVALTRAELARLESGELELVNEQRLRALATLYGIPQDWALQVAQYQVEQYTTALPATDNAYAMMTARALQMNALDPEARQTLEKIFSEIVAAVEGPKSNLPPET
jgi:transcriptional regulator with XRE-family HTH domain